MKQGSTHPQVAPFDRGSNAYAGRSPHLSNKSKHKTQKYTASNRSLAPAASPIPNPSPSLPVIPPQPWATLTGTLRTGVNKRTGTQINPCYTTAIPLKKLEAHCTPLCGERHAQVDRVPQSLSVLKQFAHFRTAARNFSTRRQRRFSVVFMQKDPVNKTLA